MAQHWTKRTAVELFVVALAGAAFGTFGPFGTFAMPLAERLAYWIAFLVVGYGMFRPTIAVAHWLAETFAVPYWLAVGLALSLAALPMSLFVVAMYAGFDLSEAVRAPHFTETYVYVWLIGLLINSLFELLYRRQGVPSGTVPEAEVLQPETGSVDFAHDFAQRLPPGFGPVLALAGEDHYVRVIGESREELVLVRLRDAVGELAGTQGLQVHRSWWVAREAVREVRRDGRKAAIVLTNGRQVPVARDKVPVLRAGGWFNGS